MKTKQLVLDAMLAAMCAVLGYISVDLGNMKFTFESFPILLGSLLFGPVDGMIIAFIGTAVYQILKWGLMSTTILWIIPYVIFALYIGLFSKKELKKAGYFTVIISAGLLLSILNTIGIFIDSKIWDYYTFAYVFGAVPLRIAVSVIKSFVFALIAPVITNAVKKSLS